MRLLAVIIVLALATPVFGQKWLDDEIWPRDIFACHRQNNCNKPIRGWTLKYSPSMIGDGSLDWEDGIFTATKGKEKRYFWIYEANGVDAKTDQSLTEFRVKQIESPDEDPYVNSLTVKALWNDDHSVAWLPGKFGGACMNYPLSGIGFSMFPISKEDCITQNNKTEICTYDADGKLKNCHHLDPITLKPWKETPQKTDCKEN